MDERYKHFKGWSFQPLTPEEKKKVWLEINDMTEAEFDQMMADNRARAVRAPKIGDPAPDFELERLGADRKPTGQSLRLAELHGRPVALAFGAYT